MIDPLRCLACLQHHNATTPQITLPGVGMICKAQLVVGAGRRSVLVQQLRECATSRFGAMRFEHDVYVLVVDLLRLAGHRDIARTVVDESLAAKPPVVAVSERVRRPRLPTPTRGQIRARA